MADGLIGGQKTEGRRQKVALFALCLLMPVFCCAEELPDPTRPPASIAAPTAAVSVETASVGLQSIIISKNRRAAIIDGETVELGGKHGDAKLIGVYEGSVVLQGVQGRQVMTLFPDVKMTVAKTTAQKEIKSDQKVKSQSPKNKARPQHGAARPAGAGVAESRLLPPTSGKAPHLNPLPEGEEAIALSPSGGKLDRGLAGNVSKAQPANTEDRRQQANQTAHEEKK